MPRTRAASTADSPTVEETAYDVVEIDCQTGAATYRVFTAEEKAARDAAIAEAEAYVPPLSEADQLRAQLAALTARLEAAGL